MAWVPCLSFSPKFHTNTADMDGQFIVQGEFDEIPEILHSLSASQVSKI